MKDWFLHHFWHETWYQHFWHWAKHFLHDHFIPHPGNGHLPKVLQTKALRVYAALLVALKVFLTVLLFVVYPSAVVFGGKISTDVIDFANQARVESGLQQLTINELLTQAAQAKADDMIAQGYFSHTAPNGDKPWVWLDSVDYRYYAAGENLAMDFSSGSSVHQAFMNSPTHRKNIMNPKYKEIGVAVAYGEMDGRQTAVLVQYFGSTEKLKTSDIVVASLDQQTAEYEQVLTEGSSQPIVKDETVVKEASEPYAVSQIESQTPAGELVTEVAELNAPVVVSVPETSQARDLVNKLVINIDRFFYAMMIFLIISLLLKIFVQIHIQHHHIIGYTLTLILLVAVLALSHFHFVERLISGVVSII